MFSALMRVVARVSGPGCEEAVVDIGKWAGGLLLGRVAHAPEVGKIPAWVKKRESRGEHSDVRRRSMSVGVG